MAMMSMRAYGLRNFENYRSIVLVHCGCNGIINSRMVECLNSVFLIRAFPLLPPELTYSPPHWKVERLSCLRWVSFKSALVGHFYIGGNSSQGSVKEDCQ